MKQIFFDNTSITTATLKVNKISDENADSVEVNIFDLARQRGGFLLNKEYKPKKITISGTVHGTDSDYLEHEIDDLKELFGRQSKNLDISYASGTRRFIATCISIRIDRDFFHLTYAPYEAEFIIPAGVGYDNNATVATIAGIVSLDYVNTVTVLGSAQPKMRTTLTLTAHNTVSEMSLLCNGDKMTVVDTFVTGDVIILDEATLKVTINGLEHDFIGIFPRFIVGLNSYQITFTATSLTYDLTYDYTKTYI
jgi:hypothetical protein